MVVYEGDSVLVNFEGVLHRTVVGAFILDGTCRKYGEFGETGQLTASFSGL